MRGLASNALVRRMTVDEAERMASWRYSGDWSVYDLSSAQPLIDELASYYAVMSDETLIGFCCIGEAARVPGMTEQPATIDVGMGMDPTLVGRGHGAAIGRTVLSYLAETYPDKALRAVVQCWNERSRRLTHRLGFEEVGQLTAVQGGRSVAYRIVKRQQREPVHHA
jgi:[ribosomal protein S18]-alanine N-acetyltransferase